MRVIGDISPNVVSVEAYLPLDGYAEVRLRENIKEVTKIKNEESVIRFEYDEYTLIVKNKDGLQSEIENNLNDWILTGRTLEINENASIIKDMKTALDILGVSE